MWSYTELSQATRDLWGVWQVTRVSVEPMPSQGTERKVFCRILRCFQFCFASFLFFWDCECANYVSLFRVYHCKLNRNLTQGQFGKEYILLKLNTTPLVSMKKDKYLKLGLAMASSHPLKINFCSLILRRVRKEEKKAKIDNILMKHCILDSFVLYKRALKTLVEWGF